MTLPEITLAIKSIETAISLIKGFNNLKSKNEILTATIDLRNSIIEIQNNLLSVQSSYQSLLDSKNEIEKELVNLKNWETDKLNYTLKQIAPRIYVYMIKELGQSPDNQYWLCPNCFDTEYRKSILQRRYPYDSDMICNSCKAIYRPPTRGD